MKLLFWASFGLAVYAYFGYPVLADLLSRLRKVARDSGPGLPELPSVTVIIPAHNEERWIVRKIENTLALDYPADRMQILVASDGSTDRTVEMARQFSTRGVEVAHYPQRAGKTPTLNRAVTQARGDIVVITDANALVEPDAVRWLVPHFADPQVGGVAGDRICLPTDSPSSEGEGLYWRYQSWIKQSQSRFRSCLAAYGQLFAVRRRLFPYILAVSDDNAIPLKIIISTGARIIFEPRAQSRIPAAPNLQQEWERKVRSQLALLYDLSYLRSGLNPLKSSIWWEFWSHQIFRLLVPWAMLTALVASTWLWKRGPIYRWLFFGQVLFYSAAIMGLLLVRRRAHFWRPFYVCFYFVFANLAAGLAWVQWLRRVNPYAWQRTDRVVPPVPSAGRKAT